MINNSPPSKKFSSIVDGPVLLSPSRSRILLITTRDIDFPVLRYCVAHILTQGWISVPYAASMPSSVKWKQTPSLCQGFTLPQDKKWILLFVFFPSQTKLSPLMPRKIAVCLVIGRNGDMTLFLLCVQVNARIWCSAQPKDQLSIYRRHHLPDNTPWLTKPKN